MLFFVLFYAIISYSLAMLLMQGFTQAAEEGARAAIAVNPLSYASEGEYDAAVTTAAETRSTAALSWLTTGQKNVLATVAGTGATKTVTVTVTYPNYATNGLMPTLTLPMVGAVPKLPQHLVGSASLLIYQN